MNEMQLVRLIDADKIKAVYEVYKYCMYMPTKEKFGKKIAEWMMMQYYFIKELDSR